jgi:hypothetical protein
VRLQDTLLKISLASVYWQLLLRNTTRSPTGVPGRLHAIRGSDHREAAVDRQDGAMQILRVF